MALQALACRDQRHGVDGGGPRRPQAAICEQGAPFFGPIVRHLGRRGCDGMPGESGGHKMLGSAVSGAQSGRRHEHDGQ